MSIASHSLSRKSKMAYATYITDALVCGVKDSNTSDRSFLLFTHEAGMLFASARSVRLERSRQRYALQEFALVRVTLIKGKSGWRIGSVEALKNYYQTAHDKAARGSVVHIFRQLRRFIHGEEAVKNLFDFVLLALEYVITPLQNRKFIDAVITLRIFNILGYVSSRNILPELLKSPLDSFDAEPDKKLLKQLNVALEQAISASHL